MFTVTLLLCAGSAYLTYRYLADESAWMRILIYTALASLVLVVGMKSLGILA